jgi:hypothetical protein
LDFATSAEDDPLADVRKRPNRALRANFSVFSNVARPPCDASMFEVNALTGQREVCHDAPSFAEAEFSHQHPNVALGFHVVSAPLDGPIGLDDEGGAGATHVLAAVIHLESPCAKGVVQCKVFIHQQREIEFLLLNESLVGFT